MNSLPPDIIGNHILPLLDGTTLTALSSVSSEFRRMIINKDELWKNICAKTWPYLLPVMNHVVYTYPGGYRSFFSDAFPCLHYSNNNNNSHFNSIDLPPINLVYYIDVYVEDGGEIESHNWPPTGWLTVAKFIRDGLNTKSDNYCDFHWLSKLPVPEKNWEWMDYFQDNLRLSWIVFVDGTRRKCAGSLFGPSSKPVSVQRTSMAIEILYEKVMLGQCKDYTEMVKCHVKVTYSSKHGGNGGKGMLLEVGMEDMNGKCVLQRHANVIILNAIQNGERKKF